MSSSFFVSLRSKVQNYLSPWLLSEPLFQRVRASSAQKGRHLECEVRPTDPEWDFVHSYFFQYAPLTYSIKHVFCVHNPPQTGQFEDSLVSMDGEAQNPVFFSPKWQTEDPTGCRAQVMTRWKESAAAFSPVAVVRSGTCKRKEVLSHVFVFPYWHGSSQQKVQSICDTGFTYFGKHNYLQEGIRDRGLSKDIGFFGSGIYFTNSARYAADIYSSGHLLLAWVSMRSPYPVIGEEEAPDMPLDKEKLAGWPAFENYDAHYVPVIASNTSNPMCPSYNPCGKDQIPMWDETVVFNKGQIQTLPRFYVELENIPIKTPISPLVILTQLLKYLQELSSKKEITQNPQLLSLFQQEKQLLFVIGDTSHLSSVDQKFFDLVRQLQTGAAKLDEYAIRQFLAFTPSLLPAPAATSSLEAPPATFLPQTSAVMNACAVQQFLASPLPAPAATSSLEAPPATFSPPPSTFLPSPFDIPPMLERSVPVEEILEASGIKEKDLVSRNPLFRKVLTWKWVHDPESWKISCLDKSVCISLLENGQMVTGESGAVVVWNLLGECLRLFEREPCSCNKVISLGEERLLFLRNRQELVIWNLVAGEILQSFHPSSHGSQIDNFILLSDCIVAICDQRTICRWDRSTGERQEFEMESPFSSSHYSSSKLFSMKKDYLVITYSENYQYNHLIIWSLEEKKCIFHEKNLLDFCLSDEEIVYLKDGSDGLFVFNPFKPSSEGPRDKPKQLIGHKERVLCCCRLKDGHVISGSKDKTLKIWETQGCQCIKTLESKTPVTKIWELKNGSVVSRGEDNTLSFWNRSGKLLQEIFLEEVESVEEIGEGKILIVLKTNITVFFTFSKTNTIIFDFTRGKQIRFSGEGFCLKEDFVLRYSRYGLQSINPTNGCVLQTFGTSTVSSPVAPYQRPDGGKLVISGSSIFYEKGKGIFRCDRPDMDPKPLLFLKEEGRILVVKEGNFQVVNPKTGEVLETFPCYRGGAYRKLISAPNGKLVALSDDRIDIWDREHDQIIKSLPIKEGLGPFWLSENVRFLVLEKKDRESFQVFLEKSAVLRASFYYKVVELQNGGIVGVSEDRFLKVWDTKGKCLRVLKDHETKISFAIELHGNRLISGSEDGVLKIWNLQSGDVVCTLTGHKGKITAICELKAGFIVSADGGGGLRVWSPDGKALCDFYLSSPVSSLLSLKDGRFVTFSIDGKYRIWNSTAVGWIDWIRGRIGWQCEQEVETHLTGSFYLAQREDGNLSIFRVDKVIKDADRIFKEAFYECVIFDLKTGKALGRSLIAQKSFRISKERMVSFFNRRAFLWDPASGECIQQTQVPSDNVRDCILLQDGSLLIGFADGTLQKWEQSGGVKTWNQKRITALLQLRDGHIVIGLCGEIGRYILEVWESDMKECLFTWDGYKGGTLLQLKDGSLIDERQRGMKWDVETGQSFDSSVDEWEWYKRKIQGFECFCELQSQDFKLLNLSQGIDLQWVLEKEVHQLQAGIELGEEEFLICEDSRLQVLNPRTNIPLRSFGDKGSISTALLFKDGSLATFDKSMSIWDPHTGKRLSEVGLPMPVSLGQKEPSEIGLFRHLEKELLNRVSFSALKIWDSLSKVCRASFQNFLPMVQLEDGSFAFASRNGIEVWNKESNKRLEILGGGFLEEPLLLQDGSILNWLEGNPTIRIWNTSDGKMVQVLRGHLDSVTCAIQLREGLVVSGSKDSTLKVWDLKEGNCLKTLLGHRGTVTSLLQLSKDRLLSGSRDETLKVWNFVTGECLKTICTKEPVFSLFQLSDERILSESNNFLQLWDLEKGVSIRSARKKDVFCKDMFDQIQSHAKVSGEEKIPLELWHTFLMPLSFPALVSSLSPFLNRLEEQVKEEILKRELPLGTQYKCQWTQKLLQNPVKLIKCGHIVEAVAFEKQKCPLCKAPIQGEVCIDLNLQAALATALEKYSVPKMALTPVEEVPDKVSTLHAQAHVHVEQKEFKKALDRYFEALQFTNRSSAYLPIAQILKDHFPAQAPLALLHLARLQAKEEDLFGMQETLRSFSNLLKYPELFELLGECAFLSQKLEEARTFYEKALGQYEFRGQKEDIIRGCEKVLACDLGNLPLYERLLKLYEEKEKKIALFYMGILYFRKKDPEKAKVFVEQAEKLDPGNPLFSLIYKRSF